MCVPCGHTSGALINIIFVPPGETLGGGPAYWRNIRPGVPQAKNKVIGLVRAYGPRRLHSLLPTARVFSTAGRRSYGAATRDGELSALVAQHTQDRVSTRRVLRLSEHSPSLPLYIYLSIYPPPVSCAFQTMFACAFMQGQVVKRLCQIERKFQSSSYNGRGYAALPGVDIRCHAC